MSFGKKTADICRRSDNREQVALAGSAMALTRSRSIIISDLSSEGAGLDGRDLPLPGHEVLVVIGTRDAFAKVVWRRDDKCGVHFEESLAPEHIEQMKQEAAWTNVAGWWR
ncbi:hypothetical protein GCM10022276_07800 [Sphingomonas limnosediminicola]|uniref:PilZ domain-containing protein n=1 Tax=Sphingomonas limnosediminicola TaxID=940133 RepID=A0ABP7L2S2_9SPHN